MLRSWADQAAEFVAVLGTLDPTWRSETFPLGGGHVVLAGRGLYFNAAMAVGLDGPVTGEAFERLESRSAAVGIDAAIEISPATHSDVEQMAIDRGYVKSRAVVALRHDLEAGDDTFDPTLTIEPAVDQIEEWQETSALGWGHTSSEARRGSDAYAAAAAVVDRPGLMLVRDAADRRPLGCASLYVRDGIATLGGMSTVPQERGRGVQGALIRHRLRLAGDARCVVAVTTTAAGSASERNLIRHGFERWFELPTLVRSSTR